jgi:adenylate kinase
MQVHKSSTFIFFVVTADSHQLEKDVVKKKIKNYGKADTESKIAIKKDAIQSSDESNQPYEDEQKSLQEKLKKLNGKEQNLVMK